MHHHQFSCTFHWSCLYLDHPLAIFKLQFLSLDSISLTSNSPTFPVHKEFIPYCCIHGCPKLQNPFSSLCVTFCSIWQFIGKQGKVGSHRYSSLPLSPTLKHLDIYFIFPICDGSLIFLIVVCVIVGLLLDEIHPTLCISIWVWMLGAFYLMILC